MTPSGPMDIKMQDLLDFLGSSNLEQVSLFIRNPLALVLQRFPPIRRRELEPSDFRPGFKCCHRIKPAS